MSSKSDRRRSDRLHDFQSAERRVFDRVGLRPTTQVVGLATLGGSLRLHEVGEGPPVVFVHGAMTTGVCWADLASRLPEFRCILVDRPGCGLCEPLPEPPTTLAARRQVGDELLVDVLDALEIDVAHVVSNSLGGWYALRGAAAHPERVGRMVAMGFQVGARIAHAPWFMRVQVPPWTIRRMPVSRGMVRRMLSAAGMRGAIESGRFDDPMVAFMVSLMSATDTMRNEMTSAPPPMSWRGPVESTQHSPDLLARITAPVHLFWGTDDPFGGEDSARDLCDALPVATYEMVHGAGHAPWIDDLDRAAASTRDHLSVCL